MMDTNIIQDVMASELTICPQCGSSFKCGANDLAFACWCTKLESLRLYPDQTKTASCFCPDCLKAFEDTPTET